MNDCNLHADPCGPCPHVLVVDDESHVRRLLVRWLTDAGCTCSEARDPEEALAQLRRQRTDLMTLDIRMPLGSGLDAVHGIGKEFPATAIVIVTADDDTKDAIAALTSGACDYLVKPVECDTFLWRIRRALAARQRRPNVAAEPTAGPRPVFLSRPNGNLARRKPDDFAAARRAADRDMGEA